MGESIVLYHNHFSPEHLEDVKQIMVKRGAPTIRCFYDEANGIWFAVEGCHRLRAAHDLGLTPIIKDISDQQTLRYQQDGDNIRVRLSDEWFDEWYSRHYSNIQLKFEEVDCA